MSDEESMARDMLPENFDTVEELWSFWDTHSSACLLYTSDAADDLLCVDLGGRRIIKQKKKKVQKTRNQYDRL